MNRAQKKSINEQWAKAIEQEKTRVSSVTGIESLPPIDGPSTPAPTPSIEHDRQNKDDHVDHHFSNRTGWLRALVLGGNDGLVSVASIMVGISAASLINKKDYDHNLVIMTGLAALVAGACSMALGEFVSVYSQRDTEKTDIAREKWELLNNPENEFGELVECYMAKGLSKELSTRVAEELSATKEQALQAHLIEEINLDPDDVANPIQAAVVSAISFAVGTAGPLLVAGLVKGAVPQLIGILIISGFMLFVFGGIGAHLGGAPLVRAALRVFISGYVAMGATFGAGALFGLATNKE